MLRNSNPLNQFVLVCLLAFTHTAVQALPQFSTSDPILQIKNQAPSPKHYAPVRVPCPADGISIRVANGISDQEKQWRAKRQQAIAVPMKDLFSRIKIPEFDSTKYLDQLSSEKRLPTIGIALSGGGIRATLNGGGVLAAFDERTPGSKDAGGLGGLLQSTTYMSGLSGGAMLVGSLFSNRFDSVHDMMLNHWDFNRSIIEGPLRADGSSGRFRYWRDALESLLAKKSANFDITVTDFWGRGIAYQVINPRDGGPSHTWSSIAGTEAFASGNIPMPFIVTVAREPGDVLVPRNATVFEFTPFEMGSWDQDILGMAPMKYVGSSFDGGKIQNDSCWTGADNTGFIIGSSSSLFNEVAIQLLDTGHSGWSGSMFAPLKKMLEEIAMPLARSDSDIARWSPNPFYNWRNASTKETNSTRLSLVDGGEDNQNVPVYPHIQPSRAVDVVFAIDSSADTQNWPDGTALVATYERDQHRALMRGARFVSIPDRNTFVNLGLNAKPTFFGCDGKNLSAPAPIVVYIPNHPYSFMSNISSATPRLPVDERNAIIRNGYNVALMGGTDPQWPQCVGCAVLGRSFERTNTTTPKQCQECFAKYCWNGTLSTGNATFNPVMVKPKQTLGARLGER